MDPGFCIYAELKCTAGFKAKAVCVWRLKRSKHLHGEEAITTWSLCFYWFVSVMYILYIGTHIIRNCIIKCWSSIINCKGVVLRSEGKDKKRAVKEIRWTESLIFSPAGLFETFHHLHPDKARALCESCPPAELSPGADLPSLPQNRPTPLPLRAGEYKGVGVNVACCRRDNVIIWMGQRGPTDCTSEREICQLKTCSCQWSFVCLWESVCAFGMTSFLIGVETVASEVNTLPFKLFWQIKPLN